MTDDKSPPEGGCKVNSSKHNTAMPRRQPGWCDGLTPIQDACEVDPEAAPQAGHRAEAIVLASILESCPEVLPPNLARLIDHAPESFAGPYAIIAQAVRALRLEGKVVNLVSVRLALPEPQRDLVLQLSVPGLALPIDLAELECGPIWEAFEKRRALSLLREAERHIESGTVSVSTVAKIVGDGLATLSQSANAGQCPEAVTIDRFERLAPDDPSELIKSGFLCRQGAALLVGPTHSGKSTMACQLALAWAIGRECLGMVPARPLKSLFVQSENSGPDLARMRDGAMHGLNLSPREMAEACAAVHVASETRLTGEAFIRQCVRPLVAKYRPDLLWLDPVLAFLGGNPSDPGIVSPFLRNWVNSLLIEFGCAAIVLAHSNKPPSGREKSTWAAGDFAYAASGSIEFANWARAVLTIRSVGSHDVFELHAAKRGAALGWRDTESGGGLGYIKHVRLQRHNGAVHWVEADPNEIPRLGRRKKGSEADLLALLPPGGLKTLEWRTLAEAERGVRKTLFHEMLKTLETEGAIIKSPVTDKWQPILK